MATAQAPDKGVVDDLQLRTTPPRVSRTHIARARLFGSDGQINDARVVVVQAPAGFGKTSFLAQLRRDQLAQGATIAWMSSREQDDPRRLVRCLAQAVRTGAARPTFGQALLGTGGADGMEGITAWLAEVAQSAINLMLIADEVDRLPPESRELLVYALHNAPPNLRVAMAARPDRDLGVEDLVAYGQCVLIGPDQLRFRLEETFEAVRVRFGTQVDRDTVARLHELTEGWPLGLQLALSVLAAGTNPQADAAAMASHGGEMRGQFVQLLLSNLATADVAFLTRLSVLDLLHPELCAVLDTSPDVPQRLTRLVRDTPIFVAVEDGEWLQMHALARDELRHGFAKLSAQEQAAVHMKAAEWLASRGLFESAARRAFAGGRHELAYDLAERSLYESFTEGGRDTVLGWLSRLPPEEIDRRPRLLLAAAWSLALSDRHEQARHYVERILALSQVDDALRCECALIASAAAIYADDPDRFAELHDPWAKNPPLRDPVLLQVHANRLALRTLLQGEPALARLRQQSAPRSGTGRALEYVNRWGEFMNGLSYLWEGQVLLADKLLRPALARAEIDVGRREPLTCMIAALLAAAAWEQDLPDDASAVLANRLDVLERSGMPETVMLAFRTLARIASSAGAEHRAIELLAALDAVGGARGLPRLRIASLAEQVRLHARRFRAETCRDLMARIDALLQDPEAPQGPLWRQQVALLREVAQGYAMIASQDWRQALEPLARASVQAKAYHLGRLQIELGGLRAFALDRCGEQSRDLLREAVDLAQTYGLQRVFSDAHPALGEWVTQVERDKTGPVAGVHNALAGAMREPPPVGPSKAHARLGTTALTPKEREVLDLLSQSMSNKEIARALDVGEETVKWHLKNLFVKLDAGTRKHLVQRGRLLGLLPET